MFAGPNLLSHYSYSSSYAIRLDNVAPVTIIRQAESTQSKHPRDTNEWMRLGP